MAEQKKKRGGDMKRLAPIGFYTAKQAMAHLGLNSSTFYYYVTQGKIKRHVPPMRSEGYYDKREIDEMATEIALFFATQKESGKETRTAHSQEDAEGIVDMLHSFGWQCASVEQYLSWWKVNPMTHFIVTDNGRVMGNIGCTPYREEVREGRLAGRKRAWDIVPEDVLPFHKGWNDVYVGIETRQDVANHRWNAYRLISGFLAFLAGLAEQGILIRYMYAVSAEKDGQELSRSIGFVELPAKPGDLENWQRYMLDLKTSDSRFAKLYRQSWRKR